MKPKAALQEKLLITIHCPFPGYQCILTENTTRVLSNVPFTSPLSFTTFLMKANTWTLTNLTRLWTNICQHLFGNSFFQIDLKHKFVRFQVIQGKYRMSSFMITWQTRYSGAPKNLFSNSLLWQSGRETWQSGASADWRLSLEWSPLQGLWLSLGLGLLVREHTTHLNTI